MPKSKYRYNPESLNYEKIQLSFKRKLNRFLIIFGSCFLASFIIIFALSFLIDLPKDRVLKRENQQLLSQHNILKEKMDLVEDGLKNLEDRDDDLYRNIFGAEQISDEQRQAGFGGANRYAELSGFNNSDIIIESARKLDILLNKAKVQSESYDEIYNLARINAERLACTPCISPIKIDNIKTIIDKVGAGFSKSRWNSLLGYARKHEGQDFAGSVKTPILATANGKIISIEVKPWSKTDYGTYILIDHGYGYKTLYGHLSKVVVKKGDKVIRGQHIGNMGRTGLSSGVHLHYEVHVNNRPVDPLGFIFHDMTPDEFDLIVARSKQITKSFD
ncbi:M23 family metallopeptidase [Bacteroidota bacterium]